MNNPNYLSAVEPFTGVVHHLVNEHLEVDFGLVDGSEDVGQGY
jgi:hypothetical protein